MKIIKKTLKNGLTLLITPMKGTKTITLMFVVRAGWKYENIKNQGISHFLEHMMFKGTKKRPTPLDVDKEIDGQGADANAETAPEYTNFYIQTSSRFTESAFDLLSDIILNSNFKQKEIDIEAGAIVEELRMYRDSPMMHAPVLLEKLLYGGQPAGFFGLGTEETIKSFKKKHLISYLKSLYVAQNAAISVAGNIKNPQQIERLAEKFFGGLTAGPPKLSKPAVVENQKEPQILLKNKKTEQVCIIIGLRACDIYSKDRFITYLLATILGGSMSSRLSTEIRSKKGLAYNIQSGFTRNTDSGYLEISAGIKREKIREGLKAILEECKKITANPVSQKEIRGAKDCLIGKNDIGLENSRAVADFTAENWALSGEILTAEKMTKEIEKITAADIQRVARNIFKNEGLNLVVIGPYKEKEKLRKIFRF